MVAPPEFFQFYGPALSFVDLSWNELISIIAELCGETLTEEDINDMDFFHRCSYLNLNPVLLARHFQYRVEILFQVFVLDAPLGKAKYHAIRVEFQEGCSPYIHSFCGYVHSTSTS